MEFQFQGEMGSVIVAGSWRLWSARGFALMSLWFVGMLMKRGFVLRKVSFK